MNPEEELRQSGEDTARLAERLRAQADRREDTARELLAASATHMKWLEVAGMGPDALATGIMTLLTIIHARVNPEKIPDTYTAYLQDLFILSLRVCRQASDSESAEHFVEISMRLGALALATFSTLCSKKDHDKTISERNRAFEEMFDSAPADFFEFQGKPITAQSAIDILSDAASRLTAIGLVD